VIAGNTSRANTHSQLLWRDGNSFERRAVSDAVTDAKTQKLGSTYTDTVDFPQKIRSFQEDQPERV